MRGQDSRFLDLLARIAGRDEQAMEEFYAWSHPVLLSYIRRIVGDFWNAEEVLQDVYRQVWLNAGGYTPERGAPGAWLFMIARSRALDSLRKNQLKPCTPVRMDEVRCESSMGEQEHIRNTEFALLRKKMLGLPEPQRHLVRLAFFEGLSHLEIAGHTGLPLGTVKSRIRNALQNLKRSMTEQVAARQPRMA